MVGKNIEELPPLIIGGAVFNTQYNSDPHNISVSNILDVAFSKGLNAIDTSPYYGPSEEIYGKALRKSLLSGTVKATSSALRLVE